MLRGKTQHFLIKMERISTEFSDVAANGVESFLNSFVILSIAVVSLMTNFSSNHTTRLPNHELERVMYHSSSSKFINISVAKGDIKSFS